MIATRIGILAGMALLTGCDSTTVISPGLPTPAPEPDRYVERVDLTAEQLAKLIDVHAFAFRYHGAPPEVWIEFQETGQDTLPPRIPESGPVGVAELSDHPQVDGSILLSWNRSPSGGGSLNLEVDGRGSYGYGLSENAFMFGWQGWGTTWRGVDPDQKLIGLPDQELTLLRWEAKESLQIGSPENASPREVVVQLKARFPEGGSAMGEDKESP